MTWQLSLINNIENNQKIKTSFLFVNAQYGKAEEAIKFYTSIFSNSEIKELEMYGAMEDQLIGKLKFGSFYLNGESFSAMDGSGNQEFNFNEGLSIVVDCNDQIEIDYYWDKLTAGGKEGQCGWVKDKFGVSWQIVPAKLDKFMSNPEKAQRVMKVIMQSKKFNIEELENA